MSSTSLRRKLLRIGYTDSGAYVSTSSDTWRGLAIDHLSKSAFNHYWDANVEPLLIAAHHYKSLKYLATDSWELGGTNWTEGFREEFIARRGYDPEESCHQFVCNLTLVLLSEKE